MTYSCDLCDNSFSTPFNLRRHMERKHGIEAGSASARDPKRRRDSMLPEVSTDDEDATDDAADSTEEVEMDSI